jgi:Fe-S-cluster containining protein
VPRRDPERPRHLVRPDLFPRSPPPRACGECTACCTVYYIDGLWPESPRWEACQHARPGAPEGGCGIYARRPASCKVYRCMWLDGWGEEADRPDRLGLVLDFDPPRPRIDSPEAVTAIEAAPGRAQEPRARARLRELAAAIRVLLVPFGAKGLDNFGQEWREAE